MSLNKQIHLYSVDTSAFYTKEEMNLHKRLSKNYTFKKELAKKLNKAKDDKQRNKILLYMDNATHRAKDVKDKLLKKLKEFNDIRSLNEKSLNKYNVVSVFESSLTRIMGLPINEITYDLMIVQAYFFDILEDIILDGYMYNGEKYICFTASAGQIRTKKTVFIKESVWNKYQNTITCGLTIDDINNKGGININKYLAYLALCNSATDLWQGFDIDKTIVVEDFETKVKANVDLINDEDYTIKQNELVEVPITHTDGCGMILPNKSNKSMMVRLPWVKGLLVPFDFKQFIEEANERDREVEINHRIIKDIYGVEHDILKEDIEVIFTKSQFKMYKYYKDWNEYKEKYIKYNCQAGKCNEEEDVIKDAKINYQMIQTLTDMTDEELESICSKTKRDITNIGRDKKTMLKVLGVSRTNLNKNYIQQSLEIYPELLNDTYCKEILKQVKKSIVKDARAAKVRIDGKYTFLCPDLYAFCEWLFLDNKNPKGLLENGQVYCNLYREAEKLDCLRSPHLYREHAVRKNTIDDKKDKWFITKGLYTSCHDVISKVLQFDKQNC